MKSRQPAARWTCQWCRKTNDPKRFTCECGKPRPKGAS